MIGFKSPRSRLQLSLITISVFLTLVAASKVSGLPLEQSGSVPFSFDVSCTSLPVGSSVVLSLRVGASGSLPVDTAQAVIDYNPGLLQVEGPIEQGAVFGNNGWIELRRFETPGHIEFAGGRPQAGGTNAIAEFELARVRFKSLGATSGAAVSFDTVSSFKTKAVFAGVDRSITTAGATIFSGSVDWDISQDCTITGNIQAPANVIVESGTALTISPGATLDINFATNYLRIKDGGKVVIKDGGKID